MVNKYANELNVFMNIFYDIKGCVDEHVLLRIQECEAEMEGVVKRFDLDSDNLINRDEFISCCKDVLGETRAVVVKFMKYQVRYRYF